MACSESHGRGTGGRRGIPGYERVTQRGELLASKDARVVYAGFLVLDRADQHAFADALPFCRLFGHSIGDRGCRAGGRCPVAVVAGNGNVRAAYYRVSDEQITEALKEVAARLGHAPNTSEYTYMRKLLYEESRAQGRPRILPSYQTINRRFGRWDKALTAAGLGTKNHTDET
jgi:Homing endonuclease associated repeat